MIETTKNTRNTKKAATATKTHSLNLEENKQIHFFVTHMLLAPWVDQKTHWKCTVRYDASYVESYERNFRPLI